MLKKRILSVILCLCMVVGMLPVITPTANAVLIGSTSYGVNLSGSYYTTQNPYYPTYQYQCTWYCWGRAMEKCGVYLPSRPERDGWGNASGWYDGAKRSIAAGNKDFSVGDTPKANSIVVFGGGSTGHVAFIERMDGVKAYITEANVTPSTGGTYGYYERSIDTSKDSSILGYIYLEDTGHYAEHQDLGDDFYAYIYNPMSGCNLESRYNSGNRIYNVQLASVNSSDFRQIWHFVKQDQGQYKIVNMYDGRCLDADSLGTTNGTNVHAYTDSGSEAQRWFFCADYNYGPYYVYPSYLTNHDLVLDVAGAGTTPGTNIQLIQNSYKETGSYHPAQSFQVNKIDNIGKIPIGNDFYAYMNHSFSGLNVGNVDGNAELITAEQYDPKQIWHFTWDSTNSAYKITNAYDDCCLDAYPYSGSSDGGNVRVYTDNGAQTERWWVCGFKGTERYYFTPIYLGDHRLAMDVANGNVNPVSPGTNIQFSKNWYLEHSIGAGGRLHDAQTFEIQYISYAKPAAPAAPINIQVTATDSGTTVTWDAVPTVGEYDNRAYYIYLASQDNEVFIPTTMIDGITYTSSEVLPNGKYFVVLRAVNTKYKSLLSDPQFYEFTIEPESTTYTVSVNATTGGTASGGGTCRDGDSITVTATPSDGYHFVKWTESGNEVSTDASYTFTVDKDRTLTAVFAEDEQPTPTYTVSVTALVGGSVSGGGIYDENTSATVIATPDTGYQFKGWTENGTQVSTEARYTFTVSANHTLVAVFEKETEEPPTPPTPVTYTVDVHASPSGGGTVTGSNTYQSGESVTVTAIPVSGYEFKGWTENGSQVSASASYTFNITTNRILTAVFEKIAIPTYSVSITASPAAGGTVSGSGTYPSGTSVTVRATANSDYQFVEWQVCGSKVCSDATYTFIVSENLELVAVFEKKEENPPTPTTYTITVNASPIEGGSVSGGKNYTGGESVTIRATPKSDYKFVEWRLNGSQVSTNASYTFTVSADQTYIAIFEKVDTPTPPTPPTPTTYTITVNASPTTGGSVSGGGTFEKNTSITVTAVPNAGYEFKGWVENGAQVSTNANYTFTAGANRTLTATFEKKTEEPPTPPTPVKYTISVSANPAAGGTVSGGNTYESGASVTVTASPSRNYRFTGWSENGQQISTNASYTFTADSDRTLVATFSYTGGNSSSDHTPSIPTTNPGGTHSGGSTTTPSPTPSLPVSTSETTSNTTTTTASPSATTKGDTAAITISSAVADEIVKQAVSNDSDQVIISPVVKGDVIKVEVTIPANVLDEVGQKTDAALLLSTPVADIAFTNNGLSNLSEHGAVTVTADTSENSIALTITAGGRVVESVRGGITLTVLIEQSAPGTVAVLVHDDGTRQIIRKSVASDDSITIPLDGSAKLEIIDNAKPFSDVSAENWAADAVAFASAHELFNGTSNNLFSPNLPMTRGMLAVVLHNLENNPGQAFSSAFSDVAGGAWYSDAVAWAAEQGIVAGYGNGLFGPSDNITREQLAVMLWRYSGEPVATNKELRFSDAGSASDYALDALRWTVENGIINGYGNGILDPKGLATRAQVAQMLMNYLKK